MVIDFVFFIVAAYGFWIGYSRGIIQTVFTVASFLFGLMAAAKFGPSMTELLQGFFPGGGALLLLVGVVLTFVLTMALFRFVAKALEGMLESVNINFINQILGGIVSAVFFVFFFSVLVMFADRSRIIDEQTKEDSLTYEFLEPFPEKAWAAGQRVWPVFEEFYFYAIDIMDQLKGDVEQRESDNIWDIEEDEDNGESSDEDSRDRDRDRYRPY